MSTTKKSKISQHDKKRFLFEKKLKQVITAITCLSKCPDCLSRRLIMFLFIYLQVEQLSEQVGEEAVLLAASITDGTFSHLGSASGKVFVEDHEEIRSQFVGYCLKSKFFNILNQGSHRPPDKCV